VFDLEGSPSRPGSRQPLAPRPVANGLPPGAPIYPVIKNADRPPKEETPKPIIPEAVVITVPDEPPVEQPAPIPVVAEVVAPEPPIEITIDPPEYNHITDDAPETPATESPPAYNAHPQGEPVLESPPMIVLPMEEDTLNKASAPAPSDQEPDLPLEPKEEPAKESEDIVPEEPAKPNVGEKETPLVPELPETRDAETPLTSEAPDLDPENNESPGPEIAKEGQPVSDISKPKTPELEPEPEESDIGKFEMPKPVIPTTSDPEINQRVTPEPEPKESEAGKDEASESPTTNNQELAQPTIPELEPAIPATTESEPAKPSTPEPSTDVVDDEPAKALTPEPEPSLPAPEESQPIITPEPESEDSTISGHKPVPELEEPATTGIDSNELANLAPLETMDQNLS